MGWLQTAWQLARDVLLTGTGLWLIVSQDRTGHPSGDIIVAGLSLIVGAATPHAVSVLSGPTSPSAQGHGGPPASSPPAPSPSPSPSPASGATGE